MDQRFLQKDPTINDPNSQSEHGVALVGVLLCGWSVLSKSCQQQKWEAGRLSRSQQARCERWDHALPCTHSGEGVCVFVYAWTCTFV